MNLLFIVNKNRLEILFQKMVKKQVKKIKLKNNNKLILNDRINNLPFNTQIFLYDIKKIKIFKNL